MEPFCSKCGIKDPEPIQTSESPDFSTGVKDVYWFLPDTDGEPVHMGLDAGGEIDFAFLCAEEKTFDYDPETEGPILCPDCFEKLCEQSEGFADVEDPEAPPQEWWDGPR